MGSVNQILAGIRSIESSIGSTREIETLPTFKFTLPPEFLAGKNELSRVARELARTFQPVSKDLEELPLRMRKSLIRLAEIAWFIDPEMPMSQTFELDRAISEGNLREAEMELIDYFFGSLGANKRGANKRGGANKRSQTQNIKISIRELKLLT